MIEAVIFDMDGLLIDSEPFWEEAEIRTYAEVGLRLTPEMKRQTTGLRADEGVQYWYARFPWQEPAQEEVAARIVARVGDLVSERGAPKPGVMQVLELCARAALPLAIASSSHQTIIRAVLDKLSLGGYFTVVHSAEHEEYGKPHPGVYLTAARKLGVAPTRCLAFEDSPNGVLAAKAARMPCIAVPDPALRDHPYFCIADAVMTSLLEFEPRVLQEL